MKASNFKQIIKDAVKEAIQEELKDILLEAVKSPKQVVTEHSLPQVDLSSAPPKTPSNMKREYMNVLDGMSKTSQDAKPAFQPNASADTINGNLPDGEVGMDQIMGLMNIK
tara:strand:+ start:89 stop:421 length:333 start_codon:yes stop_codon:yes gene_type:complete